MKYKPNKNYFKNGAETTQRIKNKINRTPNNINIDDQSGRKIIDIPVQPNKSFYLNEVPKNATLDFTNLHNENIVFSINHVKNIATSVTIDGESKWLCWEFSNGQHVFLKDTNPTNLNNNQFIGLPNKISISHQNDIENIQGFFGQKISHFKSQAIPSKI